MSGQSTVSAPVPSPAVIDTMTKVIMSQTDMTEEQVKIALEHTNYDLKRVIREYMRGGSVETAIVKDVPNSNPSVASSMSTNQMRFSEIRNFMDRSAQQYYREQEMTKIYNQVLERKKAEAAAAAAKETASTETTSKL
jgi:hypothetical protein